jgi:hypothetical protein
MKLFGVLLGIFVFCQLSDGSVLAQTRPSADAVKALYLGTDTIYNKAKIAELERILETTDANGIVIDVKDSTVISPEYIRELAGRFRSKGVYTIARIVVFQDSVLAKKTS